MEKTLEASLLPARRVDAIEAARGFCAGYVVLAHLFQIFGYRDSLSAQWPLLVDVASGYAHQAVLFFFLLSGFSIHYASMGRPMRDAKSVGHYAYLRLRRVYPIFVLTVLGILGLYGLGLAFGLPHYQKIWQTLNWAEVWATLAFVVDRNYLCGYWYQPMPTNPPFWSLSYEMLYYFLYPIFLWATRSWGIAKAMAMGAGVSLLAVLIGTLDCGHFTNVLSLYFIWCLGAVVADFKRRDVRFPMPRWMAYWVAYGSLLVVWLISESRLASLSTLAWTLLFFIVLVYPVSQARYERLSPYRRIGVLVAGFLMTLAVVGVAQVRVPSSDMSTFYSRLVLCWLLWSLLVAADARTWPGDLTRILIRRLLPLGGISYALYLVHYPLLVFAREWVGALHGWRVLALLALPVILALAYWLEMRLQPKVVRVLERMRGHLSPRAAANGAKSG